MSRGFFVTGTDTGVGKTLVACALLRAFAGTGRTVIGMKPVAAGRDPDADDADRLARASTVRAAKALTNPYAFGLPIAPHIAARLDGVEIAVERIVAAYTKLAQLADVVVAEGAGGFMVPLNAVQNGADLARALGLPVVLVVGMRLGCLNHALLTRECIAAKGLRCAGWVANCITPDMPYFDANVDALRERIDAPLLGTIPHREGMSDDTAAGLLTVDILAGAHA